MSQQQTAMAVGDDDGVPVDELGPAGDEIADGRVARRAVSMTGDDVGRHHGWSCNHVQSKVQ